MRPARADDGQVTVLVVGLSLVSFAVAGLAIDGTRAFLARRTLQNAADSSALAAASEIDQRAYYSSGGRTVILERAAARAGDSDWLSPRGITAEAVVAADQQGVRVRLAGEVRTSFLGLVGIRTISVGAEATAGPLPGSG